MAALAVTVASTSLPMFASTPAAAETVVHTADIDITSFPTSDATIELDKFDDQGGTLELQEVTVTGLVSGTIDGELTNLSEDLMKTLTASVAASIVVNGLGVTDLSAAADEANTFTVDPGGVLPFEVTDSASSSTTITDEATLAEFVGDDTLVYDVDTLVETSVAGPAPYLSTGVTRGNASVSIEYTYEPVMCPTNPDIPMDHPDCDPPPPPPDPECPPENVTKIDGVTEGPHELSRGGTITISSITSENEGEGQTFDWTSDVPILWILVKGGPSEPEPGPGAPNHEEASTLYEYPGGATSDTGLHAPENPNSGRWYGLSHITVCQGDGPPPQVCPHDPDLTIDDPDCVPVVEKCEFNQNLPADDPNCFEPCEYDPTMPADDPDCAPPPDPVCEERKIDSQEINGIKEGDTFRLNGGGSFTITGATFEHNELMSFSWSSDVGIDWIDVKGGDGSEPYDYDGATSGTALVAPDNSSGGPAGISHITICAYPLDEE